MASDFNLQVRIDSQTARKIDRFAVKSRSEFVREAILEKLRRENNLQKEKQWIQALEKFPQKKDEAADWLKAESWEGS